MQPAFAGLVRGGTRRIAADRVGAEHPRAEQADGGRADQPAPPTEADRAREQERARDREVRPLLPPARPQRERADRSAQRVVARARRTLGEERRHEQRARRGTRPAQREAVHTGRRDRGMRVRLRRPTPITTSTSANSAQAVPAVRAGSSTLVAPGRAGQISRRPPTSSGAPRAAGAAGRRSPRWSSASPPACRTRRARARPSRNSGSLGHAGVVEGLEVQLDEPLPLLLGDLQAAVDGDEVVETQLAGEAVGAAERLGGEGGQVVDVLVACPARTAAAAAGRRARCRRSVCSRRCSACSPPACSYSEGMITP